MEIIRKAMMEVICSQPDEDSLDENAMIDIFDIVSESLFYIENHWVDTIEYREFIDLISKFNTQENPCTFTMLKDLKECHDDE